MDKIHDALINIVDNCIKYTNKGEVGVSLRDTADALVITIHDTGVGIDPKELATLFDKFVRGRERGGKASGAGLGLYIAKKVIEAHGGKIVVQSEGAGAGSIFEVTILKKSFLEDVRDVALHPEISPPRGLAGGVTPQVA
jgi:signal transduction histidine kinase